MRPGERSGWTLLKFAELSDNVPAAKALICLAKGAQLGIAGIDYPLSADGPHLRMVRKCTNLHMAMLPATPPMVKLLIDARASVSAVDAS